MTTPIEHGTQRGYQRCRKVNGGRREGRSRGACSACRRANAAYIRQWRQDLFDIESARYLGPLNPLVPELISDSIYTAEEKNYLGEARPGQRLKNEYYAQLRKRQSRRDKDEEEWPE